LKHKRFLLVMLLFLALLLGGCATETENPLAKNKATAVPGLSMELHAASASDANVDQVSAMLYFRYLDEPMLAAESRELNVRRDESVEFAIVEALVEGPSAGHIDLRRLIPADAKVESVVSRDKILYVTFNEGFLNDDVPDDWATRDNWREEAPILRQLITQSLAASITETYPYSGIQILVHRQNEVQTSLRLDNAYFLNGTTGLSEPISRDETLLLTPQHTAEIILTSWQQNDFERLYRFIAETDKPSFAILSESLLTKPSLQEFNVSGGSIAGDGHNATLTVSLKTYRNNTSNEIHSYPMLLNRENGIWKISITRLTALMAQ